MRAVCQRFQRALMGADGEQNGTCMRQPTQGLALDPQENPSTGILRRDIRIGLPPAMTYRLKKRRIIRQRPVEPPDRTIRREQTDEAVHRLAQALGI